MPKLYTHTNTGTARKTLSIFWNEIKKDKKQFITYTVLIPLNRLLYLVLLPLLFSLVTQSLIIHPHNWQYPISLLGVSVLISIAAVFSAYYGFLILFKHQEKMRTELTRKAITSLMAHSDQFFSSKKVGALAGNVDKFAASILTMLDVMYVQAAGLIVNFLLSLIIIAILSPILAIPLTIVTGLLIWRSVVGTSRRAPIRTKRKLLTTKLVGTIADILGNQQIVRFFATEHREIKQVVDDRREIEAVANHEIDVLQKEGSIRQITLFTFQIITMGISVWLYTHGQISIAALIFSVTYLGRLTGALFDISPIIRNSEQAFLDASEITDILSEDPDVVDKPQALQLDVVQGKIQYENVSFSYKDNEGESVLNNIHLTISPGERIGLAGRSGGGKTTLTKLLLRFADITSGRILIDGQDISEVSQQSLRASIAYVPQEAYLFHRTLRENIAYGRPNATNEEIINAVKRANAFEFIDKLPKGLDTIVGERGVKLSGGQRQRVALARAILKNAPILVLDEATSALDSESEQLIQDALSKVMKDRTSIVIAHRLSTIAKLDRIIVLDKGSIVEEGSHAELIRHNGIYAKLWSHQSGGFIEE
jgi:ATP-binding cassette subfamily B protein